jgi:cytochrome c-type biogenesis protein CcmH
VAETVVATSTDDSSWQGTKLNITAGDALPAGLAAETVLYVMVRTPGGAMGPPIGVRRVIGPSLPMEITITDRDSMLKERMISSEAEIQIQARLSRSGSPAPAPGDWQSQKVTVGLLSNDPVELTLDQQVE